ncbi:MAG: glycosyltransferase family 2 protein [Leptospiraceae bacterium]
MTQSKDIKSTPLLSICINTRNRKDLLKETLDSFIADIQKCSELVEILVVDGQSTDGTLELLQEYSRKFPYFRFHSPDELVGIDEGYDLSVIHATGNYCWMMPDDDLLVAGGLLKICDELRSERDLYIVNLECYTKTLKTDLKQRLYTRGSDRTYQLPEDRELFLNDCLLGLSYIGSVVIRRDLWFDLDRSLYYGSYFAHVAVILGSERLHSIRYIDEPIILYRSANSSWTPRSFEIWNMKWPELVWEFEGDRIPSLEQIVPREFWNNKRTVLKSRAMGEYNLDLYRRYFSGRSNIRSRWALLIIAFLPICFLNSVVLLHCLFFKRSGLYTIYNVMSSSRCPQLSRLLVRALGLRLA